MAQITKYSIDHQFEENYLKIRAKEKRILTLDEIRQLPNIRKDHPHYQEWQLRQATFDRLQAYFKEKQPLNILDLACGNGWLINRLWTPKAYFTGVEINEYELDQAAQLLQDKDNVDLILGDIFEIILDTQMDCIIVNAAIQYFKPLDKILNHLLKQLNPNGEIHLIDSPFYPNATESKAAQARTEAYFQEFGTPSMTHFYHHHHYDLLKAFNHQLLYTPNTLKNKINRKLGRPVSPFPWIIIRA